MRIRAITSIIALWCMAGLLLLLYGCSVNHLAGGTETGNPEVTACVKRMAKASFDALNTDGEWQPAHFLDTSHASVVVVLAKNRSFTHSISGLRKKASLQSDTMIVNDSTAIVSDTIVVFDTAYRKDTVYVNKTLFVADTVWDTVRSVAGSDTALSITTKRVRDSVTVRDTVVMSDTLVNPRQRVIKRLVRYDMMGIQGDMLTAELSRDTSVVANKALEDSSFSRLYPEWSIAVVTYNSKSASANFDIISLPSSDTVRMFADAANVMVNSSESFLSLRKIIRGIVVERVVFEERDSLMSILRFDPVVYDTVESLSVAYSLDPGINPYSGTDDRLVSISQNRTYRLGAIVGMNLSIILDPSVSPAGGRDFTKGTVDITTLLTDGGSGFFNGTVDKSSGFNGILKQNAAKSQNSMTRQSKKSYLVSCDGNLNVAISELP